MYDASWQQLVERRALLRTGAAAIAAGVLLFASVFAEILVSVERDGKITNLALSSLYIAGFGAGTAALIVALHGLRALYASAKLGRAERVGLWLALAGACLLLLFAAQALVTTLMSGDSPGGFVLFGLGFLLLVAGQLLAGSVIYRAGAGRPVGQLLLLASTAAVIAVAVPADPFHDLGLINTLGALIVPQLTSALGIYLMYSFFQSFPRELEEAGRIDGCSRLQVFWKIVLPLARPALAALGIITFIYAWNDLFWPLIAITSSRTFTVQVGLATFQGEHVTEWSAVMAGTVLTTAPVLLVFLAGQRRFVQAITGAVKG